MSSPPRATVIVPLIVGCAQFMHQFDGAVIATALPAMAESLHEDPLTLNVAITCYLLALAVFVPISGWMADRYGARQVFLAAIALFTASSVMCGLSGSLVEIVIWRTLQGIGGAMMTPVGRMIVVKSAPKLELVKAMNYVTIPAVLAPLIAPVVRRLRRDLFLLAVDFLSERADRARRPRAGVDLRSGAARRDRAGARSARLRAHRARHGRTGVRLRRAWARAAADLDRDRIHRHRRDLRCALCPALPAQDGSDHRLQPACACAPSRRRSMAAGCSTSAPPRRCS